MTENSENTKDSDEVKDPYRKNQIEAEGHGRRKRTINVSAITILGFELRAPGTKVIEEYGDLRASKGDEIPDTDYVYRTFLVRCRLLKVAKGSKGHYKTPALLIFLDGFYNVSIAVGNTTFVFDEKVEAEPEVEVIYRGQCTRYGCMSNGRTDQSVKMFFKDKEQMNKYLKDL